MSAPRTQAPTLVVLAGGLAKRYGGLKPLAPAGLHGEAVIDLTVSDALSAGFGDVVMVLGPQTASAIEYHVQRCWPSWVDVDFTVQPVPLGTAHAVLCARPLVDDGPFAVVNSDDVYGAPALERLARQLQDSASVSGEQALVAFALKDTIVSDKPVTRGTCVVNADGTLSAIVERRKVSMGEDGRVRCDDGLEPAELDPEVPVSVNLWGFTDSIWAVLEEAVLSVHPGIGPDGSVRDRHQVKGDVEVLLPEVVGEVLSRPDRTSVATVRVLKSPGRCLGFTHAEDLPIVSSEIASMIGQGERPEALWSTSGGGRAAAGA